MVDTSTWTYEDSTLTGFAFLRKTLNPRTTQWCESTFMTRACKYVVEDNRGGGVISITEVRSKDEVWRGLAWELNLALTILDKCEEEGVVPERWAHLGEFNIHNVKLCGFHLNKHSKYTDISPLFIIAAKKLLSGVKNLDFQISFENLRQKAVGDQKIPMIEFTLDSLEIPTLKRAAATVSIEQVPTSNGKAKTEEEMGGGLATHELGANAS
ncbi:uncharacterized protein L201_006934 [Kwoniella dendrophila CBS 6074]|uniref:Uncharacterized protein n=1 Tax=Kwoniella dendrophila CBS 6074 TaxID=1295534 RepID=A0AAX4K5A4_9TREE